MSQHDLDIANQTFPNTRTDLNNALKALGSTSSGTSAPSTSYSNQLWYDTSSNILYIRNEDNDGNIPILELDQSNDTVEYFKSDSVRTALIEFTDGDDALAIADGGALTVSTSLDMNGTELILDSDADTSITASTDDQIDFKIAGSDRVVLDTNGVKINGSTSGGITIAVPAEAGSNTLTLPATTGEITVGGNNTPFISVNINADQTGISDNTATKINFDTVETQSGVTYDTTNKRFTVPSGAGGTYYVSTSANLRTETNTDLQVANIYIYKNGSAVQTNGWNFTANYLRTFTCTASKVIALAEGDYVEIYALINTVAGGSSRLATATASNFSVYKLIT